MLMVLYGTGIRRSIRQGKGASDRDVPLTQTAGSLTHLLAPEETQGLSVPQRL